MTVVKELAKKVAGASVAFYLLFLIGLSYLFGSVFDSGNRVHNIEVLFVNRDQGPIGAAVVAAFEDLQGPEFFSFVPKNASEYPTQDDLVRAVRDGDYWAALAVNENSTARYLSAISGNSSSSYDPSEVMVYVWNEVRNPSLSEEIYPPLFQMLASRSATMFGYMYGEKALQIYNRQSNATSVAMYALFNPIATSQINIQAMQQGVRIYYSTLTVAMIVLQQFFFGLAVHFITMNAHKSISVHTYIAFKAVGSTIFCLGAAFCMAGNMWAFRENWSVNGNQYILSVMILWLLMAIHNLLFQSLLLFLPVPAMPFMVILWVLINVTATATPFILSPGFYRVGYAVPSFEAYDVLNDIWSRGSVPSLYRALPILFSWWVVLLGTLIAGCYHLYRKESQNALADISSENSEVVLETVQKA
ncbi:hypothetical protein TRVA0_041S00562 [Trichomonascus vanleenenianus]|uniref:uncharacterized protein n=1 Tax=Trichomonascus vanleenenianus TaxID=2268995 RepID=UPI003ECB6A28